MKAWVFLCAIAGACSGSVSAAVPAQFASCDGYGAPNEHGDGMTKPALGFLGLFVPEPGRGNMTQSAIQFSQGGIAACEAALSDPRLAPAYWMRRASLLRGRATHRLAIGDTKAAIADLDAAEELGAAQHNSFFDRSFGIGIRLLRAYAFAIGGEPKRAAELADVVRRARPYANGLQVSAAEVALMATGDWDAYADWVRTASRADPVLLPTLFATEIDTGHFAEALRLRPQITFSLPRSSAGFYVEDDGKTEAEQFVREIQLDSLTAFALALAGRDKEADKLIASTRQRIALAKTPPEQQIGTRSRRETELLYVQVMQRVGPATELVNEVDWLLRMVAIARKGDAQGLLAEVERKKLPLDSTGVAVLQTLADNAPAERDALVPVIADMKARIALAHSPMPAKLEEIYATLPEVETQQRIPKYKSAKNILGENTGNGFLVSRLSLPDRFIIDFGGNTGSAAIVEEMALLRAADMARAAGKGGFIVLSRRTYTRTVTTSSIYGGRTDPAGFSAELTVAFVDPDNLPADLKDSGPRVLDAERIYADLSPIYLTHS